MDKMTSGEIARKAGISQKAVRYLRGRWDTTGMWKNI